VQRIVTKVINIWLLVSKRYEDSLRQGESECRMCTRMSRYTTDLLG